MKRKDTAEVQATKDEGELVVSLMVYGVASSWRDGLADCVLEKATKYFISSPETKYVLLKTVRVACLYGLDCPSRTTEVLGAKIQI